jgi:hypothetical protein
MSTQELHELIESLARTPETIATLVNDLPEAHLRRRSPDGRFSAVENVCHLRDIEVEGYTARINRILKEEQPFLPDIDGGRLAIERQYSSQNLSEALHAFALARKANVRALTDLDVEQLELSGTLAGLGAVTLERLLLMMREHDDGHIDDLREIRERASRENI